ncbi:YecA family protein [Legionella cardiaca]|uniref:YecA family protein n=1 Tax=Legionella cardiaca TaxID=1071983 RepID=A0ABY8AUR8_9GAMM|nr:YecA family protein [Legionella cardiaca]WED42877.1 YecA family protein [Legionella cardiaca]
MSTENSALHLPAYQTFVDTISVLALPISGSELHGIMCGYLAAGANNEGEAYLRALMVKNKKDDAVRAAALAIFDVFLISQQQLVNFDFEFQLLLPDEQESLIARAQAFGEWCEGFTQGITMAGISYEQLQEDESQEALQHILEFAQLDYESLEVDEEDEKALVEVSEYARMAVLRIYGDLLEDSHHRGGSTSTAH